jgi:anti-sigma-K factor RskA
MADAMRGPMREMSCDEVRDLAASFVLGALEPDEMAAVRVHLSTCPEAHVEIEALGAAIPALAASVPIAAPSPGLGSRILSAARAEAEAQAAATPAGEPRTAESAKPPALPYASPLGHEDGAEAPRRSIAERLGLTGWHVRPAFGLAGVAAVLALAVLGAWNLQLQRQVADLAAYRTAVLDVLDTAAAPGGQVAVLSSGDGGAARGISAVRSDGHVVVAMRDLAPTSGSVVYEAWLIGADGHPVPVGSFQVGSAGTGTLVAQVASAETGVRVALTREPAPGATAPSLPIIVQGQAQARSG